MIGNVWDHWVVHLVQFRIRLVQCSINSRLNFTLDSLRRDCWLFVSSFLIKFEWTKTTEKMKIQLSKNLTISFKHSWPTTWCQVPRASFIHIFCATIAREGLVSFPASSVITILFIPCIIVTEETQWFRESLFSKAIKIKQWMIAPKDLNSYFPLLQRAGQNNMYEFWHLM